MLPVEEITETHTNGWFLLVKMLSPEPHREGDVSRDAEEALNFKSGCRRSRDSTESDCQLIDTTSLESKPPRSLGISVKCCRCFKMKPRGEYSYFKSFYPEPFASSCDASLSPSRFLVLQIPSGDMRGPLIVSETCNMSSLPDIAFLYSRDDVPHAIHLTESIIFYIHGEAF